MPPIFSAMSSNKQSYRKWNYKYEKQTEKLTKSYWLMANTLTEQTKQICYINAAFYRMVNWKIKKN